MKLHELLATTALLAAGTGMAEVQQPPTPTPQPEDEEDDEMKDKKEQVPPPATTTTVQGIDPAVHGALKAERDAAVQESKAMALEMAGVRADVADVAASLLERSSGETWKAAATRLVGERPSLFGSVQAQATPDAPAAKPAPAPVPEQAKLPVGAALSHIEPSTTKQPSGGYTLSGTTLQRGA